MSNDVSAQAIAAVPAKTYDNTPNIRRLRGIVTEDPKAASQLEGNIIIANHPLVQSMVTKTLGRLSYHDRQDAEANATVALLQALRKFDLSSGRRFSTYASPKIRGGLLDGAEGNLNSIGIPHYLLSVQRDARIILRRARDAEADVPSDKEIAEQINAMRAAKRAAKAKRENKPVPTSKPDKKNLATAAHVRRALDAPLPPRPLDSRRSNAQDDGPSIAQSLEADTKSALEAVSDRNDAEQLHKLLRSLTDEEAAVIRLRNGLGGITALTLKEVGKIIQRTDEGVRQIQKRAMRKLKKAAVPEEAEIATV